MMMIFSYYTLTCREGKMRQKACLMRASDPMPFNVKPIKNFNLAHDLLLNQQTLGGRLCARG
jgi:hypothetical protein